MQIADWSAGSMTSATPWTEKDVPIGLVPRSV